MLTTIIGNNTNNVGRIQPTQRLIQKKRSIISKTLIKTWKKRPQSRSIAHQEEKEHLGLDDHELVTLSIKIKQDFYKYPIDFYFS